MDSRTDNVENINMKTFEGKRLFEGIEAATYYQKYRPAFKNTGIEEKIFDYISQRNKEIPLTCAVDVGCGTGQLTNLLTTYFQKVVGVDVSEAQIEIAKAAKKSDNLQYIVGTAEDLAFIPDNSVELVSSATSFVYFDLDRFFKEVDRILKPGGCFVVIFVNCSTDNNWIQLLDAKVVGEVKMEEVSKRCSTLFFEIFSDTSSNGINYLQLYIESTKELPVPPGYEDICKLMFDSEIEGNICTLDGFFKSLGFLRNRVASYNDNEGTNLFESYQNQFLEILREISDSPESVRIKFVYPFKCTFCRKPT